METLEEKNNDAEWYLVCGFRERKGKIKTLTL